MKKIIALLLLLSLTITVTGCKDTDDTTHRDSSSSAVTVGTVSSEASESVPSSEPEIIQPELFDITLSFIGDAMLANFKDENHKGNFNDYAANNPPEYFFKNVSHIFKNDDFTVANLENVLSDNALSPIEKNYDPAYWYKSKASNAKILTAAGIEAVLLNNNHTRDYGNQGLIDTKAAVTAEGIQYGYDDNVIYYEKNGFKIGIICARFWAEYNVTQGINRINNAKNSCDYLIMYFHGSSNVDAKHVPSELRRSAARRFADAGADLVIGGHPHYLQPREIYNGKEIVYSVGNFCYGGARYPENRTIIYQKTITVNPLDLTVTAESSNIIPCYVYTGSINNFQPAIITDEAQKQKVIDFMDGKADLPY